MDMCCVKRKTESTQRIMRNIIVKDLQPVGPVYNNPAVLGLRHPASSGLHFCEFGKGEIICEPRKVREIAHMDLCLSFGVELLLWLTNGDRARLYPLFVNQRNHCPVSTDNTTLQWLLIF